MRQEHPDLPLLDHARQLIKALDDLGIKPGLDEDDEDGGEEGWEDEDESDEDIDMKD